MRVGSLVLLVATAAVLAFERPADARNSCPKPRGYTQVVATGEARVFERGDSAYGCHVSTRRVVGLGIEGEDYALAGRFVSRWWVFCCDASDPQEHTIAVSNLRTGEFVRVYDVWDGPEDRWSMAGAVSESVLTRDGRIAWIACYTPAHDNYRCQKGASREYRVWRADGRGAQLVDEAKGIDIHSLRRDGSRITWRHGDVLRRATLR